MAELSGPCCACRSVSYRTECGIPAHPGTVTAWWWECDSCGRRFLPESEVDRAIAAAAEAEREACANLASERGDVAIEISDWLGQSVALDIEEAIRARADKETT